MLLFLIKKKLYTLSNLYNSITSQVSIGKKNCERKEIEDEHIGSWLCYIFQILSVVTTTVYVYIYNAINENN